MPEKSTPHLTKTKRQESAKIKSEHAKETWPPKDKGDIVKLLKAAASHFTPKSVGLKAETLIGALATQFDTKLLVNNWDGSPKFDIRRHEKKGPPKNYYNLKENDAYIEFFTDYKIGSGTATYKCVLKFVPARRPDPKIDLSKYSDDLSKLPMVETLFPKWQIITIEQRR